MSAPFSVRSAPLTTASGASACAPDPKTPAIRSPILLRSSAASDGPRSHARAAGHHHLDGVGLTRLERAIPDPLGPNDYKTIGIPSHGGATYDSPELHATAEGIVCGHGTAV